MRKILASIVIFALFLSTLPMLTVEAEVDETEYWALIVAGSGDINSIATADYMDHTLREQYNFNYVNYLRTPLTKFAVRSAITCELADLSDENDVVLIYFHSHGGGYDAIAEAIAHGRYDNKTKVELDEYPDEGDEVLESTLGWDVDGDGDEDDWVGIDEWALETQNARENETYWDDELARDLDMVTCETLIFIRQGCFGGGLIDDLSDSDQNRIIMTATNETYYSWGDSDGDHMSEWSDSFIDALHGQDTYWDNGIIHTGVLVDADVNNDETVSMLEAWEYAWDHDEKHLDGSETPWLDDNGDGYPTFENETDVFVPGDGEPTGLAATTWLSPPVINGHEHGNVNYPGAYYHYNYTELGYGIDLQVNQTDLDLASLAFFTFDWEPWGIGEGLYNPDADINLDGLVDTRDIATICRHWQLSYEQYWDGYKYEKKTAGGSVTETIDFYNRTDFVLPSLGQEKYVDGEQVVDTYAAADWKPRYAFPIRNGTQGQKYFEEGWFYFAWANP